MDGPEFALMAPDVAVPDMAQLGEAIIKALAEIEEFPHTEDSVMGHVGMAHYQHREGASFGKLMQAATQALAVAQGRGQPGWHAAEATGGAAETTAAAAVSAQVNAVFKDGIAEKYVTVQYQPVRGCQNDGTWRYRAEALVRVTGADGAIIPAGLFIPVAKRLGLLGALDRLVVTQVMRHIAAHGPVNGGATAVNLSPESVNEAGFIDWLCAQLKQQPNVAKQLIIEVSVPSISVSTAQPNALQVDESNLLANATANFADNFTIVPGADGASITYDLDVKSAGIDSGLIDVASGKPIYLFENADGTVEGRVGNAATGLADPNGAIAFTVSVNPITAEVTLDQILPIKQIVTNDPNDAANLTASDLITLTAMVTDGDNDTTSAQLPIGNTLSFHDDGPSVNVGAIDPTGLGLITQDAETAGPAFDTASANYASAFQSAVNPVYGADGAGSAVVSGYSLQIGGTEAGLSSGGLPITLTQAPNGDIVGSTNAGEVFRLSIDGAGNLTLTQSGPVDHTGGGNDLQAALANGKIILSATATVTDRDGDSVTTPLTLDPGGQYSL